ncbi:MAG: NAD(P)-dependent oxidoreductase [Alphaproteobacteria bacterium]|nr:NAD(P)-dependent oxidoreductase [Alphaproteobacteria bacterium]
MKIGVIGTGAMGAPMTLNLAKAGHQILAFDLDMKKVAAIASNTIRPAASPAAIAAECELIITMIWDDASLRAVVGGTGGICEAANFKGTLVDLSATSYQVAGEIGKALAAQGAQFLDGSVIGGGVPAARAGTSPIVIGGDAATFERYRPVLEKLGSVDYVGALGNAKITKIINNFLVGALSASNAEALVLGMAEGLKLEDLVAWTVGGSGNSHVLEAFMGRYVREGIYGIGQISHPLMAKDLTLTCELGDTFEFPALFAEYARQVYVECARELGENEMFTTVFDYYRRKLPTGA